MKLTVNGEDRHLEAERPTVAQLLGELGLANRRVAVEVNEELVRRDRHDAHVLEEGDRVEIVTFVGGGA